MMFVQFLIKIAFNETHPVFCLHYYFSSTTTTLRVYFKTTILNVDVKKNGGLNYDAYNNNVYVQ